MIFLLKIIISYYIIIDMTLTHHTFKESIIKTVIIGHIKKYIKIIID